MIKSKVEKALNDQINAEMYSFYIYLAMSNWLTDANWDGMAKWMKAQAQEEMTHAMKLFDYIHERGGHVSLDAIKKPAAEWASPLAVFEAALEHERYITGRIAKLVEIAQAEKDHGTYAFLQWYVSEQVEEEATLEPIVAKLQMAGEQVAALMGMDRYLGMRSS